MARTGTPVRISAPPAAASAASRRVTSPKSTTAVWGECSAATPRTCGSSSASSSRPTIRTPGTPLATARWWIASSRPSSPSSRATTTLPHSS